MGSHGQQHLRSQVVSSKHPKLGLTQELFFCILFSESSTGYTFTPLCVIFYSSWHRHQIEGTTGFYVSSERHRQMWGERNCISFVTAGGGIEPPSPRLTVRRYTTLPPLLRETALTIVLRISKMETLLLFFSRKKDVTSCSDRMN